MQTRMVRPLPVPRLKNIDFAIMRPREGLAWEEPESRPDALRGRRGQAHLQEAAVARQRLVRDEAGTRVLLAVGRARVGDGAQDEGVRVRVERVARVGAVVLGFVVAPAVRAVLVLEVHGHVSVGREYGLPVCW